MKRSGFTLVELVVVLIMVGILAAVAIPRFFQREAFDARAFTDQTRAMLRYAQKLAVAQNHNVFVRLNGASIALCFDNACSAANRVVPVNGENSGSDATLTACDGSRTWLCEAIPAGVAYSAVPAAIQSFYFSPLGVPYRPADAFPVSGFPTAGVRTLVITLAGGGLTGTVSVERETGYVY